MNKQNLGKLMGKSSKMDKSFCWGQTVGRNDLSFSFAPNKTNTRNRLQKWPTGKANYSKNEKKTFIFRKPFEEKEG